MLDWDRGARAEVRTSPLHGRGLFATGGFAPGDPIGVYPLLMLSHEDTAAIRATRLYHYVFYIDERADGAMRAGIAFGPISLCNHSSAPNAAFQVDAVRSEVSLTALRAIGPDEEILIDYEDFADEAL
jgi:uncharacterized protein